MSDSESSEEVEVKVEQQVEAKVKELIEKAKLILPAYSVITSLFRKILSSISINNHSKMKMSFSISCKLLSKLKPWQMKKMEKDGYSLKNTKNQLPLRDSISNRTVLKDRDTTFWKIKSVNNS
jgi:hypothetical protein